MISPRRRFPCTAFFFQLYISLFSQLSLAHSHLNHRVSADAEAAFNFLDNFLQPASGCKGLDYATSVYGRKGSGFASQFQLAATNWLAVAAGHNYSVPVLIRGHITGYTSGHECDHVKNDYTCLFLSMSTCQEELLSTGKLIDQHKHTKEDVDESMIPPLFLHMGLAWWWGIVQARIFRLQPEVMDYIDSEVAFMKTLNSGLGYPFGFPVAGLHVRHGDKSSDGFRDHSFEAELQAIKKSPECIIGPDNYCLTKSNLTFNDQNIIKSTVVNSNYSASMAIFVASDDNNVLISAKKLGHLIDSCGSGLSQKTAGSG